MGQLNLSSTETEKKDRFPLSRELYKESANDRERSGSDIRKQYNTYLTWDCRAPVSRSQWHKVT